MIALDSLSVYVMHKEPLMHHSYDEFQTFVVESSSIVNSTPLWEVSDDPNDPFPLTPSMLLTLRESPHPPLPETFGEDDLLAYGKSRWRRVQILATLLDDSGSG